MTKRGHTSNGSGTLLVERKIAGIEIRRASGTKSPEELEAIINLLTSLGEADRADLVKQVAGGAIRAVDLLRLRRAGQPLPSKPSNDERAKPYTLAERIRSERLAMPLADGIAAMMSQKTGQPSHLKEMRRQLLALSRRYPGANVGDLEGILITESEAYKKRGHRAGFTRLRANSLVLGAWADGGARGELWNAIRSGIANTPIPHKQRRKHNPLSVQRVRMFRKLLNEECKGAGDIFVALCVTGMRPSEYFGRVWFATHDYIQVNGKKNENAIRKLPVVLEVVQPHLTKVGWGRIFRRVAREQGHTVYTKEGDPLLWTPYDCRRTFAQWCDATGIPRGRTAHYLGHGPAGITDVYAFRPPTLKEIAEDGPRLWDFMEATLEADKAAHDADKATLRAHRPAHRAFNWDGE